MLKDTDSFDAQTFAEDRVSQPADRSRSKRPDMLKDINAVQAHDLIENNAILVDVREPYEIQAERIPGSVELPLSHLARGRPANLPQDRAVVFHCASGARTKSNGMALASLTGGDAYNLVGGIGAWRRAGFPTTRG